MRLLVRNLVRGGTCLGLSLLFVAPWAQAEESSARVVKSDRVVSSERTASSDRVVEGASAPSSESEPSSEAPAPEPTAAPGVAAPRLVVVHIDSPSEVVLETNAAGSWQETCVSPCDRAVPAAATYRIVAPGIRRSDAFALDAATGERVTIEVEPASATVRGLGVAAMIVGFTPILVAATVAVGGALVIGVIVLIGCPIADALGDNFGGCAEELFGGAASGYWEVVSDPVALGIMGGGIVLGATGIVLVSTNKSTKVQLLGGSAFAMPRTTFGGLTTPRPLAIPVLSATF